MMKASGRAALIGMAGLFLLLGGLAEAAPSSAQTGKSDGAGKQADAVKTSKHRRHSYRRAAGKTAQLPADKTGKQDPAPTTESAKGDGDSPVSGQMPPEVANANAQLAAADTPTAAAASAMTGRANDNVQAAADHTAAPNAEGQVVEPDQLNDVDRALQQDPQPVQKVVIAATEAQPRPAPVMASSQNSLWDQSSLIGKIFIGIGTLLTLASAARMFMA